MQNHQPYNQGTGATEFDNYLQWVKHSSDGLADFIARLSKLDEPTIVLFIGDHFPSLRGEDGIYAQLGITSENCSTLYEQKYVMWNNFGLDMTKVQPQEEVSVFYLPYVMMQEVGMPKDSFTQSMMDEMPVTPIYSTNYAPGQERNEKLDTLTYDRMQKTIASKLNRAENKNLHFVSYTEYKDNLNTQHGEIAVIIAEGEIQEGQSQSGITGAETLVSLIDQAREYPSVKALVLRVNSPGGSAVASELIRHAIETTKSEKPVIVSMGDLAASGGFWISMGASKVLAASSTITGSIGVFGLAPTFENTLKLAKIGQGTVATTWLANAERLTQPMDPRLETIFTQSVAKTYANFVNIVAQSRKLTPAYVQTVAQGRVWTGSQAAKRKLVDEIGDFQDAIKLARSLAHLDNNAGFVYLIEPNADLGSILKESIGDWISPLGQLGLTEEIRSELKHSQRLLQNEMNAKLFNVYAHSLLELIQ